MNKFTQISEFTLSSVAASSYNNTEKSKDKEMQNKIKM